MTSPLPIHRIEELRDIIESSSVEMKEHFADAGFDFDSLSLSELMKEANHAIRIGKAAIEGFRQS